MSEIGPLFMNKANRDAAWRAAGKPARRRSSRSQLIHPQYIEDYPDESIKRDNGIGNEHYKTHFAVLYTWGW